MKKLILSCFAICAMSTIGFSQLNFGVGAQFMFEGNTFGLQGKALYNINDTWRAGGTFTYYLEDSNNWAVDVDAHYRLLNISDNFNISPLAGLNFIDSAGVNSPDIGINLGAYFDLIVGKKDYHVYVEPKLIVRSGGGLVVSSGILF